ncbi:MAG: hypothetical protein A2W29_09030 [Gemmatimonadetes bacterium RBG_16_66_8]|nr:MAG: hypothetical protein A2W29_09030 [Gemmatimonadetes bacterium RBG_16_66_8]
MAILRRAARGTAVGLVAVLLGGNARAQQFVPPEDGDGAPVRFGLFGFGARAGVDFAGRNQAIASVTLDAGDVFTNRLRFRPSVEIGVGDPATTYVGNAEILYRFTPDTALAVPYVGFGAGVWGQQQCNQVVACPGFWFQTVLGFELQLRDQINWLLEYHGEDALRRHRFFIGLTTRRGS